MPTAEYATAFGKTLDKFVLFMFFSRPIDPNGLMIQEIRRLSSRGADKGVCVDAEGATLGSAQALVWRTSLGFEALARDEAATLQQCALRDERDPDWLFRQAQRIAAALDRGEVALAQIYGLYIPVENIDGPGLRAFAAAGPLRKAGFNPDEPRIPAGEPGGGQWTTDDDAATSPSVSPSQGRDEWPSSPTPALIGGRWPAPVQTSPVSWLQPIQAEPDENGRGGLLGDFMDLPREFRLEMYQALRSRLRDIEPRNPALQTLTRPDFSPKQADIARLSEALLEAQARAGEPPATAWELGWGARGVALERQRLAGERTLPFNTPTIDDFPQGVALSIKSIDLNAPWYRNPLNLSRQIDCCVLGD